MNVYDEVAISTVETPSEENGFTREQILINGIDPIEVTSINDLGAVLCVKGISYNTGDGAVYFLSPDTIVGLWAV